MSGISTTVGCLSGPETLVVFSLMLWESFYFDSCFIHPPSIRPIVLKFSDKRIYFLLFIDFISHARRVRNLTESSRVDARSIAEIFWLRFKKLAENNISAVSINNVSILKPSV